MTFPKISLECVAPSYTQGRFYHQAIDDFMQTPQATPRADPPVHCSSLPPPLTSGELKCPGLCLCKPHLPSGLPTYSEILFSFGIIRIISNHISRLPLRPLPLRTQSSWRVGTIFSAVLNPVKRGLASTHLLNTDCVPGTVLGVGALVENEEKNVSAAREFIFWREQRGDERQ